MGQTKNKEFITLNCLYSFLFDPFYNWRQEKMPYYLFSRGNREDTLNAISQLPGNSWKKN